MQAAQPLGSCVQGNPMLVKVPVEDQNAMAGTDKRIAEETIPLS